MLIRYIRISLVSDIKIAGSKLSIINLSKTPLSDTHFKDRKSSTSELNDPRFMMLAGVVIKTRIKRTSILIRILVRIDDVPFLLM